MAPKRWTRRATGFLGFFGSVGLGFAVWLGLSWTEDSRKKKLMEYYKFHPDELARQEENNAKMIAIIKKAARMNEDTSEPSGNKKPQ